ncbi:hypothetical protein [Candidatus Reidiella endopervernicosa]|uniref:Membrane integrity-associated transporter subunit PqiC n=1 Tax=Candidatus Reidiella endopervernicosa TaxID=2738883 RepID=A0A6N0HT95_9GAMM|nr:hypothetical protein [Candidatus Reidiella endopervernicosa]QKQ25625.1 hypothetical protein HUE57_04425 [Candidatus Reidiella endopervernicosa]
MKLHMLLITSICFSTILMGCVPAYKGVIYDKEIGIVTNQTAEINVISGRSNGGSTTTMAYIGNGVYMPISSGPSTSQWFGMDKQLILVQSLKNALINNHAYKNVAIGNTGNADANITIEFIRTHHQPDPHVYTFDVAMKATNSKSSITKRYHIKSEDTFLGAYFDNTTDAMNKASSKLISAIIDDLKPWISNTHQTISSTNPH